MLSRRLRRGRPGPNFVRVFGHHGKNDFRDLQYLGVICGYDSSTSFGGCP